MVLGFLGNLFGGGGGPKSPSDMGYERDPRFDDLINYDGGNFMGSTEAMGFSDTLFNAVDQGNLDQNAAMAMVNSRINPDSGYFKSKEFDDLLNYRMGDDRVRTIIGDSFATNYFRTGDPKEIEAFYLAAQAAGATNNPNELRNFMTRRLARTPEGESKRPFDEYQYKMASYYGAPVRDSQGNNTGQYAVFGRGEKGAERVAAAQAVIDKGARAMKSGKTGRFVDKALAKMGGKEIYG